MSVAQLQPGLSQLCFHGRALGLLLSLSGCVKVPSLWLVVRDYWKSLCRVLSHRFGSSLCNKWRAKCACAVGRESERKLPSPLSSVQFRAVRITEAGKSCGVYMDGVTDA